MRTTFLLGLAGVAAGAGTYVDNVDRPAFGHQARVKQHRQGAKGELIKDEKEHRKMIISWEDFPGAALYEVCHQCNVDDATGVRTGKDGEATEVALDHTCGGKPCFVRPATPRGKNVWNLRAKKGDGSWTPWSAHRNWDVQEPGYVKHKHVEL